MNIFIARATGTSLTNKAELESNPNRRTAISPRWKGLGNLSSVFLRLALGISFLSAVADRFGLWGAYGSANVSWGSYARFVGYVSKLNWFLPAALIPALSIIVAAAEVLFGLLLVVGWKTRITARLSGVLLTIFALTMMVAWGVKAPLDFSVFSAAGGALLLAACADFPFSLDKLLGQGRNARIEPPSERAIRHKNQGMS